MKALEAKTAIQMMMAETHKTHRTLSEALGKSEGYISSTLNQGGNVTVDTLARIAESMGYTIVLQGHGESIPLKARKRKEARRGCKVKQHRMDNKPN